MVAAGHVPPDRDLAPVHRTAILGAGLFLEVPRQAGTLERHPESQGLAVGTDDHRGRQNFGIGR